MKTNVNMYTIILCPLKLSLKMQCSAFKSDKNVSLGQLSTLSGGDFLVLSVKAPLFPGVISM